MRRAVVTAAALLAAAGCGGDAKPSHEIAGTIAFAAGKCCGDPEQVPLDIWQMNGDGSERRRLTSNPSSERDPSWSPDGSRLVARSGEALFVINSDGGERRKLVPGGVHPIWSPRGDLIAFTRNRDGYVVNADGTGLRRLFGDGFPGDWSPDGTKIAVSSDLGGMPQIYVYRADGSGGRRLSQVDSHDYDPDWSPDGRRIAFVGVRGTAVVSTDVYVMNADGRGERRVTKLPQRDGECFHSSILGVDWSPDGEWIAFGIGYVGCKKLGDIYVVRPDGSDLTRLTTSGFDVDPAWHP